MKHLRLLIGLFVLGAAVYLLWKTAPAFFANYQFEEEMDDTARMSAMDVGKTPDDIRASVLAKAQSHDIPIDAENIEVVRSGADVSISANYVVHVDVPVYPFDLKFHPSSKREGLKLK